MNSIPRISSAFSEPWAAWVMFMLLIILALSETLQRGMMLTAFRNLSATKERSNLFNIAQTNTFGKWLLYAYKIGIFSMFLLALLFREGTFTIRYFWLLAACVLALFVFKYLISRLLAYVFFTPQIFRTALYHYTNLTTCCAILLYPIVLLMLFMPQIGQIPLLLLAATLLLFFTITLLIKIFHLFFHQILAGLYIFLYLCSLEVIPLLGLYYIGDYIIN